MFSSVALIEWLCLFCFYIPVLIWDLHLLYVDCLTTVIGMPCSCLGYISPSYLD